MKKLQKIIEVVPGTKTFLATTVQLDCVKPSEILLSVKLPGGHSKTIPVHNVLQKYLGEQRTSTLFNKAKVVMPFQIKVIEQAGVYSLSDDTAYNWAESAKFKTNY